MQCSSKARCKKLIVIVRDGYNRIEYVVLAGQGTDTFCPEVAGSIKQPLTPTAVGPLPWLPCPIRVLIEMGDARRPPSSYDVRRR